MKDKYTSQKKYIATLKQVSLKIKPEIYDAFREKCLLNGTTPTTELRKFINEYISK